MIDQRAEHRSQDLRPAELQHSQKVPPQKEHALPAGLLQRGKDLHPRRSRPAQGQDRIPHIQSRLSVPRMRDLTDHPDQRTHPTEPTRSGALQKHIRRRTDLCQREKQIGGADVPQTRIHQLQPIDLVLRLQRKGTSPEPDDRVHAPWHMQGDQRQHHQGGAVHRVLEKGLHQHRRYTEVLLHTRGRDLPVTRRHIQICSQLRLPTHHLSGHDRHRLEHATGIITPITNDSHTLTRTGTHQPNTHRNGTNRNLHTRPTAPT